MSDPSDHYNTAVGTSDSRPVYHGKWLIGVLAVGLVVHLMLEYDLLNPIYEWFRSDFELWLNNHSVLAPAVYILVYVLSVVALIPGSVLTLVGGGVFGPLWGSIYVSVAATVAAGLAFLIARYLAANWVERKTSGKLNRLKRAIEAEAWRFLAFVRLVPVLPYSFLNYVFGLTRIKFWVYILVSWACMLPVIVAYVCAGYAGKKVVFGGGGWEYYLTYLGIAVGLIFLASTLSKIIRKLRGKPIDEVIEGEPQESMEYCFTGGGGGSSLEHPREKSKASAGVVGPHAHDMNFSQLVQLASEIDLAKLADELSQLRAKMKSEPDTPERDPSIGEVAAAEVAAKDGKGPQALEHLKKAGKRALEVAEKIGTTVAASALKSSLGL